MANSVQIFYRRLLQRRPLEVIIVLLFLLSIILFQIISPDTFRQEDDPFAKKASRESKLTRREAIWEVIFLQEQVEKLKKQVSSLEAEIRSLKAPPNETASLKDSSSYPDPKANLLPYGIYDAKGFHIVNNGLNNAEMMAGKPQGELVSSIEKDLNTFRQHIIKQYNTNPKDGIFYRDLYETAEKGELREDHFWIGMFRLAPHIGMEYQLMFRDPSPNDINDEQIYSVTIAKPFHEPHVKQVLHLNSKSKIIHIILPLRDRLHSFDTFLSNLASVKSSTTFEIHLSVIHVGPTGIERVKRAIADAAKLGLANIHLINIESDHINRNIAIQRGMEQWKKGNHITFVSDVGLSFGQEFLQRCALHTQSEQSVYFPIVFSQYNPNLTSFFSKPSNSTENKTFRIDSDNGYWREYDYDIYCIYQVDYQRIVGQKLWEKTSTRDTWGDGNAYLYKVISQGFQIRPVRVPDSDIIQLWHPTQCPSTLEPSILNRCRSSWVDNEGSPQQLGLLHVKDVYQRFKASNKSMILP